jgi:hypothetical protein
VCALLILILSGSLSAGVAFADDESKTVPAREEESKKLGMAKTEAGWQSDSAASETSAPQEPTMASWTVGVTHRFNELVSVRPEVRYEYAFSAQPWDNGTRKGQLMFAMDALMRF